MPEGHHNGGHLEGGEGALHLAQAGTRRSCWVLRLARLLRLILCQVLFELDNRGRRGVVPLLGLLQCQGSRAGSEQIGAQAAIRALAKAKGGPA